MFENKKVREAVAQAARNVWGIATILATVVVMLMLLATVAYYEAQGGQQVGFPPWLLRLAAGTWGALLLLSAFILQRIRDEYVSYNNLGKRLVYIEVRRTDGMILTSTGVARGEFYWRKDTKAVLYVVALPNNNRIDTGEQTGIAHLEVGGQSVLATVHYSLIAELDGGFSPRDLLDMGSPGVDSWFKREFLAATAGVGTELAEAAGEDPNPHMLAEIIRGRVQAHSSFQFGNLPQNLKWLTVRTRLDLPGSSAWLTK